jgi:acetyl-CoA acyltransferase 2
MSVPPYWLPIDIWLQFQGICDGAGAVILASEKAVLEFGLKPLARLVGYSVVGVEPTIMGIGPAPAIVKLLKASGKQLSDIDLVEVMSTHSGAGWHPVSFRKDLKPSLCLLTVAKSSCHLFSRFESMPLLFVAV